MKSLLLLLILPVVLCEKKKPFCEVNSRILGGEYAEEGEFPEVVFLKAEFRYGSLQGTMRCGGSLISEHWVLTAGHCLVMSEPYLPFVSVKVYPNRNHPKFIQSKDVIIHMGYGPINLHNDIALIKLPYSMATIYPNFNTVSLPLQGQPLTSNEVTLVGWGRTNTTDDTLASHLMKLEHVQLNQTLCRRISWSETKALCRYATVSTGSTCPGDSGGPIFMDGLQVGIVSGVAPKETRGFYLNKDTRVSAYRNWIDARTGLNMS